MAKPRIILYWVATLWLSLGMLSSAIVQLIKMPEVVLSFDRLGYPRYLLTILGIWKIAGIIVLIAPKLPLVKEWAYAGFFFVASGALVSHIAVGDGFGEIFPSVLLLALTVASWYLRPEERRI